ncbi:MAG: hypothetical protein KJS97_10475 [Alphaproteobacteria bacterium]|nr:hypothetical protein [Alphaproteobacteria bacterium]
MSRNAKPLTVRMSASFAGLRPLTALTACAALSAWANPALARTETAPALLEVEAPMPPPHIQPANANDRAPTAPDHTAAPSPGAPPRRA